jgi:hypothetical protein
MMKRIESRRFLQNALKSRMNDFRFAGKGTSFTKKLNDETSLWVGLQIVERYRPLLAVFPRVGFANWMVAEFFRERLQFPLPGHIPLTLHATLGYLVPGPLQTEALCEPVEESIRNTAKAATDNVIEFGLPFMTRYPDLHQLVGWARDPMIEPHGMVFQPTLLRGAILHLAGENNEARILISRDIAETPDEHRNDPNFAPTLRLNSILAAL